MSEQEFLETQERIYQKFRDSNIKRDGTNPSDIVVNGLRAYLIAFRHSSKINELIVSFSERIGKEVPIVSYTVENIHTTISDYEQKSPQEFEVNSYILRRLNRAVSSIEELKAPLIDYYEWLYNENTVIIAGRSTGEFYNLAQKFIDEAKGDGIELRVPWGAHITATRFKEKRSPEELKDFFKLMKEVPILGESNPEFIDVGWYDLNSERFIFNVDKDKNRYNLKGSNKIFF